MVEPKSRKYFHFIVFLLPCLVLYTLFFIYPFLNGVYISMTNWDNLTPKAPITMAAGEFETRILDKVAKESDRAYLLSVYSKNEATDTWNRLSMSGGTRRKVESIIRKTGYEPERNRFVGLQNYADILGGKVSSTFYPRSFVQSYYNISSALPQQILKKDFKAHFLGKLTAGERAVFDTYYEESGDLYRLKEGWSEFALEDSIWLIGEHRANGAIPEDSIVTFIAEVKKAQVARGADSRDLVDSMVSRFAADNRLSAGDRASVAESARKLWALGEVKLLMADKWTSKGFDLGVVGFTLFFAIFSVLGINILAFALALALDTGIHAQKALRSVFFLPNVLSMIIVALIWKMLLFQMFPKLTGIEQWLSDPVKTPWILVLVAVWQGAGYYMIVYLAGLQNIPTDVVEAAKIDGASPWQRFRNITLPLLIPAITISLFLTIANALKSFDLIYAMVGQSAYTYGTVPVVLDIYFDAFARKQAGMATAKAMLLFAIIFAVTGLQLYIMKKKEIEQ